jgi:hypothetical protein
MRSVAQFLLFASGFIGTARAQAPSPAPTGAAASASANATAPAPQDAAAQLPAPVYAPAEGAPAAQVEQPAPVRPAAIYYAPPPAPIEPKPGARLHDGFYLRMSLGLGRGSAKMNYPISATNDIELRYSGLAMMFDILIGGSPVPGFVLGGGLVSHSIMNPKIKSGGVEYDTANNEDSLNLSTFGLFAAIYPDPKSGFNLHALVGYSSISSDNSASIGVHHPDGPSVMGGVGYDFWVGEQWSLGPDVRLAYAHCRSTDGNEETTVSMFVPTLSFTATYH